MATTVKQSLTAQHSDGSSKNPNFGSVVKNFLVSTFEFWFALALASSGVGLAIFSETDFYNKLFGRYGNRMLCLLCSVLVSVHFVLYLSHRKRKIGAPLGVLGKTLASSAVLFGTQLFHWVPDKSVGGLLFVICCSVDVLALMQIVRPRTDYRLLNFLLVAVMVRAMELYHFSGPSRFVFVFCSGLLVLRYWLEDAVVDVVAVSQKTGAVKLRTPLEMGMVL